MSKMQGDFFTMNNCYKKYKYFICCVLLLLTAFMFSSCAKGKEPSPPTLLPATIYEDDICKIVAEDFTDPHETTYTFNLTLTIENKTDETFGVASYYGKMNGRKVLVLYPHSYELYVNPGKSVTEIFQVSYGTTDIRDINEVKSIETEFTLFSSNSSKNILETGNVAIRVK